jgi:lysophospholipase L1-like esterase
MAIPNSPRCWKGVVLMASLTLPGWSAPGQDTNPDWPNLAAYRCANAELGAPAKGETRVVFLGDSITEFWPKSQWTDGHINRGISGQTTPQMLLRLRQDVLDLHPQVLVLLAGTNDVAGNTGPATVEMIVGNIASMVELAQVHHIRVVLCAVPPASGFSWSPEVKPAERILELNGQLKALARQHRIRFVDYHTPMKDDRLGLKADFSEDGVHPNEAGYRLMKRLVDQAIQATLGTKGKS